MRAWTLLPIGLALAACEPAQNTEEPIYDTAVVETRDIDVTVQAAGVIEPETTVEVKSKASGEILAVHAETGDVVESNTLLVEVDQRTPRNQLAEAEASLIAAQARRRIAQTQLNRSETLFESGTLTQADFEQAQLELATAQAQVVSAEVAVENARIAMEDTAVRAPITGTIILKQVEPGMVISSPTQAVSDGTVLMQMADLTIVQVRTLVDETDIGKVAPGMPARVVVAAYPNQPFEGEVLKIEPQAIAEQNVTMFAVLIQLENQGGLLRPGMNADVEISIADRDEVPALPTAALRTNDDIEAVAAMLGMSETQIARAVLGEEGAASLSQSLTFNGRRIELPDGVDADEIRALFEKRQSGASLTSDEQQRLRSIMGQAFAGGGGFRGGPPGGWDGGSNGAGSRSRSGGVSAYQFGGSYWVVAMRGGTPTPVRVETGLTDLEFTEVVAGLELGDAVLLLPSASLFEQQTRLQSFISERFSGGTPFSQGGGGRRRGPPFF